MYKMLIVDDDMISRMDIRVLVDWNSIGIELLEDAVNGVEALKSVEKHNPDIIILDLGMPLTGGLEVISRLGEKGFQGKIIVLSCHDDFDNVKEAMRLGADDYILKHLLEPENMVSIIKKMIGALQFEYRDREEKQKMRRISEQNISILKDNFIRDMIKGYIIEKNDVLMRLEQLDIKMEFTRYGIVLIEIDELHILKQKSTNRLINTILESLRRIIEETLGKRENCISGCFEEGKYCILINFDCSQSYMGINSKIYEICEQILVNAQNYLNIGVSAGISKIFNDISSIRDCYGQARLALDGKLYMGKNKIIHFSEIENYTNIPQNVLREYESEIYGSITKGKEIEKCIDSVFSSVKSQSIKIDYMRLLNFELLALASRVAKDFNLGYEEVFGYEYIPYRHVMQLETIYEIQQWFTDICLKISVMIRHKGFDGKNELRMEIKKALNYIQDNYMKNISLQEAADHSNLSRAYFCNLFKQEMNENFNEYLSRYRIEKAKLLLKDSDMKIYEVGLACGFDNYRYFTTLFKELEGISPGEFKVSVKKLY